MKVALLKLTLIISSSAVFISSYKSTLCVQANFCPYWSFHHGTQTLETLLVLQKLMKLTTLYNI
jgi:hypothetical protein